MLITGATSGIGRAAAQQCAAYGAEVHVLGHNPERAEEAMRWLTRHAPEGRFHPELCDLQSLDDIRRFAEDFAARVPALHALAQNAGVFSDSREVTAEGNERSLTVHVLAPHLLNHLLRPTLAAVAGSRVVYVSSGGMYASSLPADDLEYERSRYSGTRAYARTKRMQVVAAAEWSRQLAEDGIAVHSMHPGWVDTPGVRTYLTKFRLLTPPVIRPPSHGADTLTWLLASPLPDLRAGGFWHDRAQRPTHYFAWTRESGADRRRLWEYCEKQTQPFRTPVDSHPSMD